MSMQKHIDERKYHVEILTPKQNSLKIEEDLESFALKYRKSYDAGYVACVTDNPMGLPSFKVTECIRELELPVHPEQLLVHLNTFHTREELDELLTDIKSLGGKYLLVVSGDGCSRLHRLAPAEINMDGEAVTSVELLRYINQHYPGQFECGVAFNQYEPQDHELKKMERKIGEGASFIITQPALDLDEKILACQKFNVPIIIDAWMSKKLHLLSECVGYTIPETTTHDPITT
jgi:methylenetetrahydrofolate reductase (NADPH)